MSNRLRIALVAGEESGDILGASLLKSLKVLYPELQAEGIGGDRMIAEGLDSLYPMERLSVMGLVEPLKRLPELLRIRKSLVSRLLADPPDVFVGIDSPDFNLDLEGALKAAGIKTVHYVSPSVWAWRQNRIKKIKRNVDLMLALFPFETVFYQRHGMPVSFVGHPLADEFELAPDQLEYRRKLGLDAQGQYVAVLPGSRESEVEKLLPIFIEAMKLCHASNRHLHFLVPAANARRHAQIQSMIAGQQLPLTVVLKHSREVMAASDVVLLASGTSTLEAMLLKKPMVVAYRMPAVSYMLIASLLKTPYVALPNLLSGKLLVPELIQKNATPEALAEAVNDFLDHPEKADALRGVFYDLHQQLQGDAGARAASAICHLLQPTSAGAAS